MIQNMHHSGAKCVISKDNDLLDLEAKPKQYPKKIHKIIAFESVYFICISIGPVNEICDLAEQYGVPTFLDEVHHIENDGKVFLLNNNVSGSYCWPVWSPWCWCHQTSGS